MGDGGIDLGTALIAGLVAGIVCGLVPLIVGIAKEQLALGIGGFAACAAAGPVLGLLLAGPVAGLFTYLIVRRTRDGQAVVPATVAPAAAPPVSAPASPPAGWHEDPYGGGGQRWWDGTRWTEHVLPAGQAAEPSGPRESRASTPGPHPA